jgi:hypothetical protein
LAREGQKNACFDSQQEQLLLDARDDEYAGKSNSSIIKVVEYLVSRKLDCDDVKASLMAE